MALAPASPVTTIAPAADDDDDELQCTGHKAPSLWPTSRTRARTA